MASAGSKPSFWKPSAAVAILTLTAVAAFCYFFESLAAFHPYKIVFRGEGLTHAELIEIEVLQGYTRYLPVAADNITYSSRPYAGIFEASFGMSEEELLAWSSAMGLEGKEVEHNIVQLREISEEEFTYRDGLSFSREQVTEDGVDVWLNLEYDRKSERAYMQVHID